MAKELNTTHPLSLGSQLHTSKHWLMGHFQVKLPFFRPAFAVNLRFVSGPT